MIGISSNRVRSLLHICWHLLPLNNRVQWKMHGLPELISLSTLKSVTTRYKFCCFLLTKRTGELYPVKPLQIIPSFSNLSISFCIICFWSSQILYGLTKKGLSSHSFNFTSKYEHVPISSPNAECCCVFEH